MKLIKIRFTSRRDQRDSPRSAVFQEQLDTWTTRLSVLYAAAARINDQQRLADSESLQTQAATIIAEVQRIDAERALLLSVEATAVQAEVRAAGEHKKVGTFGYQVLSDAGTYVGYVVDEAGNLLPTKAVYSYEVVDENPPLPQWAKDGKFGR